MRIANNSTNLWHKLTPEQQERIKALRQHQASKVDTVSEYDRFLAEFGYYYGWSGVMAVDSNEIDAQRAASLLMGARKVWAAKVADHAVATRVAGVEKSGQFKKSVEMLQRGGE